MVRSSDAQGGRSGPSSSRDQFLPLPAAPRGDIRALGGERAGWLSLLGEAAEGHHAYGTARLANTDAPLDEFLGDVSALGVKLGCVLVQLPPSLQLDATVADGFLAALRERYGGMVALEPRHVTWFTNDASALLAAYHVARVAADPPHAPEGGEPGGWMGAAYYRMHGSPRVYYTAYDEDQLARLAAAIRERTGMGPVWCIFDNTAAGAAVPDALTLQQMLGD